jgi:hypothetical protein
MASREVFHFDEFTLDVQERRLLRGAEVARLVLRTAGRRGRLSFRDRDRSEAYAGGSAHPPFCL